MGKKGGTCLQGQKCFIVVTALAILIAGTVTAMWRGAWVTLDEMVKQSKDDEALSRPAFLHAGGNCLQEVWQEMV